MANIYDEDIAAAQEMIAVFGQPVIWQAGGAATPVDPDKPWLGETPGTPTEHQVSIVFLPTNRENMALIRALSDTTIVAGSLIGLMGAVDFELAQTDIVIRDGQPLSIRYIDTLAPNGAPILHTIGFDV